MLIRDPVHGDIELSSLEAAVLDLPAVQRLRGIKQLGTAHLVYPGAVHTRFDHSLGACAVSHRIVASLRRTGTPVSRDLENLIGVAALLHDVTHVPFGHTLEDERRIFARHDKGRRLGHLLSGELGERLAALGVRDEVSWLLGVGATALPEWTREVVANTIDADLLDYLRRDSYFAGLTHNYDDRVFYYFLVAGNGRLALGMARHGMERLDARSEIIQLLRMRYFLTERVYYHHTKVVSGAMISKAVELAVDGGVLQEGDLLELNDWTLIDRLARTGLPAVAALIGRLQRRDLLKRGYVVSAGTIGSERRTELVRQYHESRERRAHMEAQLAIRLGLAPDEVILYCPAFSLMKEAAALVEAGGRISRLNDPQSAVYAEISALEQRYENLWRLYVFVPEAATTRTAAVAAELIGHPTEHGLRPTV